MKKVSVVGCGAYMESGHRCPGEWRCLKAASLEEGSFTEPHSVVSFVSCECPDRTVVPNLGMAANRSEMKPDVIHFSTCLSSAKPNCPYTMLENLAELVEQDWRRGSAGNTRLPLGFRKSCTRNAGFGHKSQQFANILPTFFGTGNY